MDKKDRVYYLVNFNRNHFKEGWSSNNWDKDGVIYANNVKELQSSIKSLKITENNQSKYTNLNFQRKISCLKKEERCLINAFNKLNNVEYVKIV